MHHHFYYVISWIFQIYMIMCIMSLYDLEIYPLEHWMERKVKKDHCVQFQFTLSPGWSWKGEHPIPIHWHFIPSICSQSSHDLCISREVLASVIYLNMKLEAFHTLILHTACCENVKGILPRFSSPSSFSSTWCKFPLPKLIKWTEIYFPLDVSFHLQLVAPHSVDSFHLHIT